MKKFYFSIIALPLFCVPSMKGMIVQAEPPVLTIRNATANDKLAVLFVLKGESPHAITLIEKQEFTIDKPNSLEKLYITIYGDYKKWLTAPKLSRGYLTLKNLLPLVREGQEKDPYSNLLLQVKRWGWYVSAMLPYNFVIGPEPYLEETPPKTWILEYFPQVQKAYMAKRPIRDYYWLSLPKNAPKEDVQFMYDKLLTDWTEGLPANDRAKFALDAIDYLKAAYASLMQGGEAAKDYEEKMKNVVFTIG